MGYKLFLKLLLIIADRPVSYTHLDVYKRQLYDDQSDDNPVMRNMHVLAAEMEAAGLYLEAMRAGKGALCLVTVVDNPYPCLLYTSCWRRRPG